MRKPASTERIETSGGSVQRAPVTPTAPYSPERKGRVDSVDLLRGLIMVIMMLDHTRDFVHFQATLFDPSDVSRTYPALFFTRWITHFCAPVFVFLAGTGAYFQELRGKPKIELSRFLITRGIWLIVLEFTVLRVIIFFNFDYPSFLGFLQVIWVIGWGMIVLAGLIYLPLRVVLAMSVAMIVLHNAFDGIRSASWAGPGSPVPGFGASLWKVLHEPGLIFPLGYPGPPLLVLYPLIPWLGVLAAGYALGSLYRLDESHRRRFLFRLGSAITLGFIVLRAINIYGDPSHWSVQSSPVMTALSFLAVSKYPPSLLFLMMTLGPALLFLAWFDGGGRGKLGQIFIVYGRVPLFFYLLQWIVTHTLALAAGRIAGKPTDYLFTNIGLAGPAAPGSGFGLAMVYALWILGVVLLYPLCRWYAGVKTRRRDWWLSYL
jgi:uncharacterized membrane protein